MCESGCDHKIDDAAHPVGFILCRWIGNHLYSFYLGCRNLAERIGTGTGVHQRGRLAVYQDAYVLTAPQTDVSLHIHLHGGDVAHQVTDRTGSAHQVSTHIEYTFVDAHHVGGATALHHYFVQLFR